jgi:Icc-related predicted phosphoesterase
LQWVEQLYAIADQGFSELEQVRQSPTMRLFALSDVVKDASTLETIIQQAENLLPSLREEHAQVIRELEQEQSITAEIGNCDQGYLSELKATLAEQGYCRTFTARSGNDN